jgi:uncharacterized protein
MEVCCERHVRKNGRKAESTRRDGKACRQELINGNPDVCASVSQYGHDEIEFGHVGIGLRAPHYSDLQSRRFDPEHAPQFFEVHSENFFGDGGQPLAYLDWFRARYPLSVHGVGLSLGGTDALDKRHLDKLKRLVDRFEPALISEHLCWVGVGGIYINDLLPIPYTRPSLAHVVSRIDQTQSFLKRPILIENVSSYLEFSASEIPEWAFLAEVAERAGCGILLDVNNIYVNSVNHGFDAQAYLAAIPVHVVKEIHLAGFQNTGEILIDTHGAPISEPVWALYASALTRFGAVPTLIEWDTDIPPLDNLIGEAAKARRLMVGSTKNKPSHQRDSLRSDVYG